MENSITIREYGPADKVAVMNLIRLNTPEYFALEEETDLNEYLENKRELYYVLIFDGDIVGCGGINFVKNRKVAKISWDILHPEYQRRSFGSQLLRYRIDKLKTIEGVREIMVRTSQLAYGFYEKHGFVLSEIKKDYWAKGFDMYCMKYKMKDLLEKER